MEMNPLLLIDFYKACHSDQYPKNMTKLVSYYTPRMSRLDGLDYLIHFGLQGYIQEYLINNFNKYFFEKNIDEVIDEYKLIMDNSIGKDIVNYEKIRQLHKLGYLPIYIKGISEGTKVPIGVPIIEITNTHPDFAWLVNTIETQMSCYLWHCQISATIGHLYRQIADKYYNDTVDDAELLVNKAIGDFSMRGQESVESAIKSSAGFCLSFLNTATVPVVKYFIENYCADIIKDKIIIGTPSTEHSVMNSNFAVDGDEITMIKRLLTEIYPNNSFNMVSDSYDYWNLINNILPLCKEEILNHRGFFGIRGDSGSPIDITTESVFKLWDIFGGTINKKGFKELNSKIKVIYGDSITLTRAEKIYQILKEKGFAANNVSLAAGSFSMQCLENIHNNELSPFTRDTFGVAIKSTYCEVDNKPIHIFKDPKTDTGHFKKSHKGCCLVYKVDNQLKCRDTFDYDELQTKSILSFNVLKPIFENGMFLNKMSLNEIRNNLYDGKF